MDIIVHLQDHIYHISWERSMGTIFSFPVIIWNAFRIYVPLWVDIQVNAGFPVLFCFGY